MYGDGGASNVIVTTGMQVWRTLKIYVLQGFLGLLLGLACTFDNWCRSQRGRYSDKIMI